MISVVVGTCQEDKPAPKVTDDLIRTKEMALKRAEQELAEMSLIVKRRQLELPLIRLYEIGSLQPFSYSKFQIDGLHRVLSWKFSLTFDSLNTSVELQQTESMCNG